MSSVDPTLDTVRESAALATCLTAYVAAGLWAWAGWPPWVAAVAFVTVLLMGSTVEAWWLVERERERE